MKTSFYRSQTFWILTSIVTLASILRSHLYTMGLDADEDAN